MFKINFTNPQNGKNALLKHDKIISLWKKSHIKAIDVAWLQHKNDAHVIYKYTY